MDNGKRTSRQELGPQSLVLCALTAACYDNQVRALGLELPELYTPDDESDRAGSGPEGEELVQQEGWIYFPK